MRAPLWATQAREAPRSPLPVLFVVTIFAAAGLLFVVQPMVGKLVLPRAGGSPQVWNTSLVFFQTALLAGYLYAHLSVRLLGVRKQAILHMGVLALPLLAMPIGLPDSYPPAGDSQAPWVLTALTLAVGAPFVVLAASSPLIQRWLAASRHEAAGDPYFLYAASNGGSLVALLAYPFVLEPLLPLSRQSSLWTLGYLAFAALTVVCAIPVISSTRASVPRSPPPSLHARRSARPIDSRDRLFWIAAAAVPSALLLGVTQYLTTEIAPFSLLWVLPLAIYLCTFIIAFARRRIASVQRVSRLVAIVAVVAALALLTRTSEPPWLIALLHLAVLATGGLLCHMRLAASRPPVSDLTEYYLLIATGGAIGGFLSGLVAPVVFDTIAEYPIAVAAACLFLSPLERTPGDPEGDAERRAERRLDLALPAALAGYVFAMTWTTGTVGLADGWTVLLVAVAPTLACFLMSRRPVRFTLGMAVLFAAAASGQLFRGDLVLKERTFFAVHRVVQDAEGSVNVLYSGSTVHGVQSTDPARATEPLGYYHPSGPAGTVVSAVAALPEKRVIAMVGVGTGALAVLAGAHQHVALYEIDPAILRIAEASGLFTYLASSRATLEAVVGDARVTMSRSRASYDLIVMDAFSGRTIPLHLLTREAVQLYMDRLAPGGALLFHVSNPHLELAPVLAAHARDLGLAAWEAVDRRDDAALEAGIFGSHWVLVARPGEALGFPTDRGWRPLEHPEDRRAWTDDFSNILSVQRWR